VVFHHLRRRKLERRIFDAAANVDLIGTALSSPARTARARTLLARVRRHLEEMETNKAWTFVLHDVLGFDLREIAQITEVSVAAAQRRLVRGRTELHERIAEDPELAGSLTELEGDR
ncbi:MAG: RNA polymerase sigma factor, partial [Polyangiales bacterium]